MRQTGEGVVSDEETTLFFYPAEPHCRSQDLPVIREIEEFRSIVDANTSFVLTTHVNPDGDGLGCECAMAEYLRTLRKRVRILNHSATPPQYQFLDPEKTIEQFDAARHTEVIATADVIIVLDTNHPDRLGSMKAAVMSSGAKKICIDHHLDRGPFADLYILDEPATATGEIVYKIIGYPNGPALTSAITTPLYTAIVTDTGGFRYPKTDPEIHRIVAHLIEQGADPVSIYNNVYDQGSSNRVRLLGRVLGGLATAFDGRLAYLTVTRAVLDDTGTSEADTDAFVPYTLSIQGVHIGLMFTEMPDGAKVNFRSKGDIQINELAKLFGGNGHKNAAGARIANVTLSEVIPQVLEQARHFLP